MRKLAASRWPGAVLVLGGLSWEAISNGLGGWWIFAGGAAWLIVALYAENHDLKKQLDPKLRLVYDQDLRSPYVREKKLYDKDGKLLPQFLRIFSVGVLNSGANVDGVSVKLMRIEPDENPERYGLSLQVLDAVVAPGTSESSVSTSPHSPHVFYELLTQEMPSPDAPPRYAALRFAHPMLFDRVVLSGRDQYFITLKINGVGACPAQRFVLQKNNRGQYEMRPAMYD